MSDALMVAVVMSIPPTLVALSGVFLALRAERKAHEVATDAGGKLDHITQLTNSTLSAANKRIATLEAEVARLKGIET